MLTTLLAEVDADGQATVLERRHSEYGARVLLQTWIGTRTWLDSKNFFDEHSAELNAPAVTSLLASLDFPDARRHVAILHLAGRLPSDQVYAIVTDHDALTDHAFCAVESADIPLLRHILAAHARPLTGVTGAFLALVTSAAGNGDKTQARQLAEAIAQYSGSEIQRQAYAIRLRALARRAPELAYAAELADLIHRDEST
jgi:hypothetical protein